MNWISNDPDSVEDDDHITEWLLSSEERLKLKPINVIKNSVTINIWIDSCHKKPIRIDKTERVYQIVQKLIGIGHCVDFSLSIGNTLFGSRFMDDDEILYDCLKDMGIKF